MARVVISVPHALCRDDNDKVLHQCDVVAERIAKKLFDLLTDKGHRVALRIADINRTEVDFNRPEGRDTPWRKALADDFPKADFLLDCHSYPKSDKWPLDLYLLKWVDNNGGDNRKHVYDLLSHLSQVDLDVATSHSAKENDIVAHALEHNLPAILVEFDETSVADDEKRVVSRFVEAFDAFLNKSVKKKVEEGQVHELLGRLWTSKK